MGIFSNLFGKKKQGKEKKAPQPPHQLNPIGVEINDRYSPLFINALEDNEVFVFGSNLEGMHGGGAARIAMKKYGAVWGKGDGHYGKSYAIPTMHGGVADIKPYVDKFIEYAKNNPDLIFLVTRIGCGIAGFKDSDIAPLFAKALDIKNIKLPKKFVDILECQ